MNLEDTKTIKAIPERKLLEIKKKNRLGKGFMLSGIVMFLLGAYVIVVTQLTLSALFILIMALFLGMYGSHLYSGQYTQAAQEKALEAIKSIGGLRK